MKYKERKKPTKNSLEDCNKKKTMHWQKDNVKVHNFNSMHRQVPALPAIANLETKTKRRRKRKRKTIQTAQKIHLMVKLYEI